MTKYIVKKISCQNESLNIIIQKSLVLVSLCVICVFGLVRMSEARASDEQLDIGSVQSLKMSAYSQVGYTHWEQGKEGFRIKQARITLRGDILENIDYKFQIDAQTTPILLEARIGLNFSALARLSFGQFKIPFSIENLVSGSDLDTINRSNTVKNLCPGRDNGAIGRDIGMTLSGKYSALAYTLGVFNGSGINKINTDGQLDIAGRLVVTSFSPLSIGFSHYNGRYIPEVGMPVAKSARTGVDISFVSERSSLKGEYIFVRNEQVERSGWYIQGGYYLIKKKLEAIIKQDSFDGNRTTPGDQIDVTTLGINYFFSKMTKCLINYEYRWGHFNDASKSVFLAQIQAGF